MLLCTILLFRFSLQSMPKQSPFCWEFFCCYPYTTVPNSLFTFRIMCDRKKKKKKNNRRIYRPYDSRTSQTRFCRVLNLYRLYMDFVFLASQSAFLSTKFYCKVFFNASILPMKIIDTA